MAREDVIDTWTDDGGEYFWKIRKPAPEGQRFRQADADAALHRIEDIVLDARETQRIVVKAELEGDGAALILTYSIT
jgi:hypothetical protein